MYKRKLGVKHWISLGIVAYLIGVNLLYFFLLKPISSKLEAIRTRKSVAEDYYLLNTARQTTREFRHRLVKLDELDSARTGIIDLARRYNVTPLTVDYFSSEENIGWGLIKIPIKVQLQGSYHDIGSFISRLESSEKLFVLEDLHISSEHNAKFILYAIRSAK